MGCDLICEILEEDESKEVKKLENKYPLPYHENKWNSYDTLTKNPYITQSYYNSKTNFSDQETVNGTYLYPANYQGLPQNYNELQCISQGQNIMLKRHNERLFEQDLPSKSYDSYSAVVVKNKKDLSIKSDDATSVSKNSQNSKAFGGKSKINLPKPGVTNKNDLSENFDEKGERISTLQIPATKIEDQVNEAIMSVPTAPEEEIIGKEMLKGKVDIINNVLDQQKTLDKNSYEGRLLSAINIARTNPSKYAKLIEKSMKYIEEEQIKSFDERTGSEIIHSQIVFKKKVKVALNKGRSAFEEAAKILKSLPPMPPLRIRRKIAIPPPSTYEEYKDPEYGYKMAQMIRQRHNINIFFKENIKNPEVAALLMIVDDSSVNPGKKRNAVLNPMFKKMAVGERFFGNNFVAYVTFSK